MKHFPRIYGGLLVLLTVFAASRLIDPAVPNLAATGLLVCAAAPLGFLVWTRYRCGGERHHPVLVSSTSGLGCVMIMVSILRYGDAHSYLLGLGVLILTGWMVYQRKYWRKDSRAHPDRRDD